ncbi:hypothetical protein KO361_04850 [Candidatus Woesearchaeota archaeon]|nr:hypothetical protein [Candidatus Woesearchaeota archaeon]
MTKLKIRNNYLLLLDGLKLFFRSKKKKFLGTKKYEGTTNKICEKIIIDCYNTKKKYFMVSPNNFNQFYSRDFGMICESLIKLGYEQEVINTINYAMNIYEKKGRITTQINSRGQPLDFPCWTPESTSYMLNSIILTNNKELINKYKSFFKEQARIIYEEAIDKETGLVRKDKNFSSMKDYAKQKSSCYVNCLVGLFSENLKKIGLKTELQKYDYEYIIKKYFWKKNYFADDLSGKNLMSGDANVFPYWTKLITNKDMFKKSLKSIKEKKLNEPFALKYNKEEDNADWNLMNYLNKNYENETIWSHLAICYLKTLYYFKEDKEVRIELIKQLNKHSELIKKQRTMYEVYTKEGKPFKSLVFEYDEAMSWCAEILELNKLLKK